MRALDRRIEIYFPLRNVAGRAQVVVELRTAGVIDAGGEVDIVVAGSAGGPGRVGQIRGRLRRPRSLRVAGFAPSRIPWISRENDLRIIEGPKGINRRHVRSARLHAG